MPRKGKLVSVPDEDIPVLESMKYSPDEELSLPAKIILELRDNPSPQAAANALDVTEPTIIKWRDRYLEDGIDGLHPRKRNNHSVTPAEVSVRAFLEKADPEKTWTAKEIADELHLNQRQVQNVLKKLGLPLERKRSWTCQTLDIIDGPGPYIAGLYLTCDVQIIVCCSFKGRNLSGWDVKGLVYTYNSAFAERLAASADKLSMQDVLVTAVGFSDTAVRTTMTSPASFIETTIGEWEDVSDTTLYVYSCSATPVAYHGKRLKNVFLEHFPSLDGWLQKIHGLLWPIDVAQFCTIESEMRAINSYIKSCNQKSAPFMWRMCYSESGPAIQQPDISPTFEGEDMTMEEMLGTFLSDVEMKPGYQECVSLLISKNEEGRIVYQVSRPDAGLPSTADFDVSTQEGFEASINALDECATAIGREVDKSARQFYLNEVKKNR